MECSKDATLAEAEQKARAGKLQPFALWRRARSVAGVERAGRQCWERGAGGEGAMDGEFVVSRSRAGVVVGVQRGHFRRENGTGRWDGGIRTQYDRGSRSGFFGRVGADFEAAHHEVHHGFPGREVDVVHEGADVFEEYLAGGQFGADQAVGLVAVCQERVGQ